MSMQQCLDIGDLPPELTSNPSALVCIAGLDVEGNPVHRTIWDSFTANRPGERVPLSLKLLPSGHEFPKAKPKRSSYDWYVPKGLLKRSWLQKHLSLVPAVAVQFVDLDWDCPTWNEKRQECASKLEMLRESLQGRSTRIALVLIQKRAALPGTDDQIAAERAASLCSACDLSGKTLFVLPHSDHLYGYTQRLQTAFYELAQTYYHHEGRRIKNHKDHLNKTTHQLLFVRHQFKIAFLTELKQDIPAALKNYKQAYANLMEVRTTDANMLEIKTIAGFINYKMCRLSFLDGSPLDAISQFRNHVDIFKNKIGHPELAFEHSAWMSKQFSHFGDLFEDAVQQGLNAIQTQHPGFYYQQAANHAANRKIMCYRLCKSIEKPSDFEVLEGADTLEFYGQRPWRSCCQSLEPPDPQLELKGILALKYREYHEVDHSMIIIPLLSSAVAQFKKYKCPRMKRQLTVEMGEEYYSYKDYKQALTLLKHVLWDYRVEKWKPIVSSILTTALRSAYLSASVQDYISLGIEMISNWILCSNDEKSIVQNNINNVLQGKLLFPMPGISEQDNREADKLWQEAASRKEPLIFTIQMASIVPFIECKAGFASDSYMSDQRVTVTVYLRMNCPQPMSFSKLSVLFNNEKYNRFCEISPPCHGDKSVHSMEEKNMQKLYLVPRNTHIFSFNFVPDVSDIGKVIQITSIALQLGSEFGVCAVLHWTAPKETYLNTARAGSFSDDLTFQSILPQFQTTILPRNAHITMDIAHDPPALVNEYYEFRLSVTNDEICEIRNVILNVGLKEGQEQFVHDTTHLSETPDHPQHFVQYLKNVSFEEIAPGQTVEKIIYMKAIYMKEVSARRLFFEVTYDIQIEVDDQQLCCCCCKVQDLTISTVEPFEFLVKVLNMKFEEQQSIRAEEPFILKIDVQSYSSLPLHLENSVLELPHHISFVDAASGASQVKNLTLQYNEAATECFVMVVPVDCPSKINLGNYTLKWKRIQSPPNALTVESSLLLPSVDVMHPPVHVSLDCPSHGAVRCLMPLKYAIHNRTTSVQHLRVTYDDSDDFMFAGNKQMELKILPRDFHELRYNLYPLVSGYAVLPHLQLLLNPDQSGQMSLDTLIKEMLPSHVFVMPHGKKSQGTDVTISA